MRTVRQLFAPTLLALVLGTPAYAGIIDTPTITLPPPPPAAAPAPGDIGTASLTSAAISLIINVLSIP